MKSFTVIAGPEGKSVVRAAINAYPSLKPPVLHKALKKKDVRVNGKRIHKDEIVFGGDHVELWLPDSLFFPEPSAAKAAKPLYEILFEDDRLLVVHKRPGISVHSGGNSETLSLVDLLRQDCGDPQITLCHRLDRNTGGVLLLAKGSAAAKEVELLFRTGLITKKYRCLVRGVPRQGVPCLSEDDTVMRELCAYLEKDKMGEVYVHGEPGNSYLPIVTHYRVMQSFEHAGPEGEAVSELEVELITGRTHQIRVHFASIGHPVLGDGKYGRNLFNKHFQGVKYQQLYAVSLRFASLPRGHLLSHVSGKIFSVSPEFGFGGVEKR